MRLRFASIAAARIRPWQPTSGASPFMPGSNIDPIDIALREDIGPGDITTDAFVSQTLSASARIVAREKAIVAGAQTAADVFQRVDPSLKIDILRADGCEVSPDDIVLEIRGSARSILKAERVALNFLQRLSG